MREFKTEKAALDFLAARIAAEAEREGAPLSETERKMLYFSETDWTLPDMAKVSAEFDRECNQNEYERKIAGLIHKITVHHHGNNLNEEENWDEAIAKLSEGDRYILVMVNLGRSSASGFLPTLNPLATRPPHDFLKLVVTAMAICVLALGVVLSAHALHDTKWPAAVWAMRHEGGFTYLLILVAALVFSFRNYLKSAIQSWRDRRSRVS